MIQTYKKQGGFTLIEIVIVIAILAVVFSFGLFISLDFYKNYSFGSEKNVIVSVLQKARSQSLNNINQTKHGVRFDTNGYALFEGPTFTGSTNTFTIPSGYNTTVSVVPAGDIIFDQLSGTTSAAKTVTVTSNGKSYTITINREGRIDW